MKRGAKGKTEAGKPASGSSCAEWRARYDRALQQADQEENLEALPERIEAALRQRRAWLEERYEALADRADMTLDATTRKKAELKVGRLIEAPAKNKSQTAYRTLATLRAMDRLFKQEPIALRQPVGYIAWAIWSDRRNLYPRRCPTYKTLLALIGILLPDPKLGWGKARERRKMVKKDLKPDARHQANLAAFRRFKSNPDS
jgi:hypothetical protein